MAAETIELDTTVSGEVANSYVSVDEADAYFTSHFSQAKSSAWAGITEEQKVTALRVACSVIETLPFHDSAAGPHVWNQALSFPRDADYVVAEQDYIVPQVVKDAQCEQAVYLLTADEAAMTAQMQGTWEESVQVDTVKIGNVYSGGGVTASMVAPLAFQLLRPYIRKGSAKIRRA
jgi:hypothetical protein